MKKLTAIIVLMLTTITYSDLQEQYSPTTNNYTNISGTTKRGQVFTASANYDVNAISVKIYKVGSPYTTLNASIWACDVNGFPINSALSTGTLATSGISTTGGSNTTFHDITMTTASLTTNTKYVILLQGNTSKDDANCVRWRFIDTGAYSGGWRVYYTGSAWVKLATPDAAFRVYGNLTATTYDTNCPEPNVMTWANEPNAVSNAEIDMVATTATDSNGVEYQFEQDKADVKTLTDWRDDPNYHDTGLDSNTTYIYRVRARDKSENQNITDWSASVSETTTAETGTTGTYYLDSVHGDDTKDGKTAGTAWKTLSKTLATISSGDTVRCKTGSYGTFSKAGSSGYTKETTFVRDTASDIPVFGAVNLNHTANVVKNITFDGITMQYAYISHAQYVKLLNCTVRNTVSWHDILKSTALWNVGGVLMEYSDYITVQNCDIYKHAQGIMSDYATHVTLSGNKIHGVANDMIQYGGGVLNSVYDRNNIYDMDSLVFPFKTPWNTLVWDTVGAGVTQNDAIAGDANLVIPASFTGIVASKNYTSFDASYIGRWELNIRSNPGVAFTGDLVLRFSDEINGGTGGHYYDAALPGLGDNTTTNIALVKFSSAAEITANPACGSTDPNYPLSAITDCRSISLVVKTPYAGSRIYTFRTTNSAGTTEQSTYFRHPSNTINTIDADNFRCNMNQATSNVTIRKNIVHGLWSTGTGTAFSLGGSNWANTYPLNDSTIENNLVFGNRSNHLFRFAAGQNVIIQNNTIVGLISRLKSTSYYDATHFTSDTFKPIIPTDNTGTYTGSGCRIRNNILSSAYVSSGGAGYTTPTVNSYVNMTWTKNVAQDIYSTIMSTNPDNYEISSQTTYSLDSSCFISPTFAITNTNVSDINSLSRGFKLKGTNSIAYNYGDPCNQPTDSLGDVDANGFIINNGGIRDATHHSAGCYEYDSTGTSQSTDTSAPSPNPPTIYSDPANSTTSITVHVNPCTDTNPPIYYQFHNYTYGMYSLWQTSTTWTNAGLDPNHIYLVRVRAKDSLGNTGSYSTPVNCVTQNTPEDTNQPTPTTMTWSIPPYVINSTSIGMTATTASDASGVEYLFNCTTDANFSTSYQDSSTYIATGLTPGTTYAFTVIARDKSVNRNTCTVSASASATTTAVYTLTATANDANGTIDPNMASVLTGTNQTFTATPSAGYQVDTWYLDGTATATTGNIYTLSNITANHIVLVTFKIIPPVILQYTVVVVQPRYASISPTGTVMVDYNSTQIFTALPDTGCKVDKWIIDGKAVQIGGNTLTFTLNTIPAPYRFAFDSAITSHTLTATIKKERRTLWR